MPAQKTTSLLRNVISQLRKRADVTTLSDSTGASLTGRQTLVRALVLTPWFVPTVVAVSADGTVLDRLAP